MNNIKRLREQVKITQEEMASRLGLTQQAIAKWEAGNLPRAELLPQLAKVLGCTIDELFGEGERAS